MQLIKDILKPWNNMLLFAGDVVDGSAVYIYSHTFVFLRYNRDR